MDTEAKLMNAAMRPESFASRARLFVGSDGGPVHMASAVGYPCVTVTSAIDFPGTWEPRNSRGQTARTQIDCEFRLSMTCRPLKTNACIMAIEIKEVLSFWRPVLRVPSSNRIHPQPAVASQLGFQL